MSSKKSSNNDQKELGQDVPVSKAIKDLREEIIVEAKKLASMQTSSAVGILTKTRELIHLENMNK